MGSSSFSNFRINGMTLVGLGIAVGACLMFILDPRSGRRRRALMRDQGVHARKMAEHFAVKKARHFSNRARGMMIKANQRMQEMSSSQFNVEAMKPSQKSEPDIQNGQEISPSLDLRAA